MTDNSGIGSTLERDRMSHALFWIVMARAISSNAVIQGGAVKQRAAGANMSVDVDELYFVQPGLNPTKITATNKSIDASDPTNPRFDILYINASGALTISKGTAMVLKPAGESNWKKYYEPYENDLSSTSGIPLALICVRAGTTSILDTDIQMIGQITDLNVSGWIPWRVGWTYAGASDEFFTFTVPGDQTLIFTKGTKIKLTQTTTKYFEVVKSSYGAPNTTVTIWGFGVYTLADATITDPWYTRGYAAGWPAAVYESQDWLALADTVAYQSWDSDIKTGVARATGVDLTGILKEGQKVKFYQSATQKFAFITRVTYSGGNTDIYLYMYDTSVLANATISSFCYSTAAAPKAFPLDQAGWRIFWGDTDTHSQADPVASTYYNLNSHSAYVPMGTFVLQYGGDCQITDDVEGDKMGYIVIAETVGGSGWLLSHSMCFFNTDKYQGRAGPELIQMTYTAKQQIFLLAMTFDSGLTSIGVIGHYATIYPAYLGNY